MNVINRHHFKKKPLPEPWVYVGRGTPLGNPFTKQEYGDNAIPLYRKWLWDKIKTNDPAIMSALSNLTGDHNLVCSCFPRNCHANIIVAAWEYLKKAGKI